MKVSNEDLKQVEDVIKTQGHPIFFENEYGKFALVFTPAAKRKFLNNGYIAITLNELRNWIKEEKTFKKQQEKVLQICKNLTENFKELKEIKEIFKGEIIDYKP